MKKRGLDKENGRKGVSLFLLFFFLLAIISVVLGILCLGELHDPFFKRYFVLLSIAYSAVVCIITLLIIRASYNGGVGLKKGALSAYILWNVLLCVAFALLRWGIFDRISSVEELQEYLGKSGVWAPICYILLQFLQVTVLPIPSIVSTLAGVALFGPFQAMIYSLIGILSGSILAFFIGRRLGIKAVAWLVGEEKVVVWQKKLKGKDNLFLTAMFILPFFPDDILCFLAGLSLMSVRYFLVMIFIARLLGISATCYSFDFIPFNTWWGMLFWVIVIIIIACAFSLMSKQADKIQSYLRNLWERIKKKR
ncbi:MAG: TVP38/TMEM64 family protein [Clostridiales bacterium]|nr:TVP38/TMEM64 family protein [Clostridiales bacterium]